LGWKGPLKAIQSNPCHEQGHLQLDEVTQSLVQPDLGRLQGWGIHHLAGQPVPGPHHPQCKTLLPSIQSESSLFQFKAITLVLLLQALLKSLSPSFLQAPFKYWKAAVRCPQSLLFSRLSSPSSPSLSSQQRGSSLRIIAGAPSGPSSTAPGLSCAEGSRAGCRTPGVVSAERGRGAESPPSPCAPTAGDAAQGTVGLQGCERTLPGHVQLCIPQHPQVLLGRGPLHPFIPQPVLILGIIGD